METRVKNITAKILNVLAVIVGVFVLIIAVTAISSAANGDKYSSLFGYTAYAVKTDSMDGDKADSFKKGDLIFVRLLEGEQRGGLTAGQIITFLDNIDTDGDGIKEKQLNSHRITAVRPDGSYTTQGDKAGSEPDIYPVKPENVVGVYSSKAANLGNFVLFIQSPAGFLALVVIPSILVVIYCAYLFIKNLKVYNNEKKSGELEKMRLEIMKEMTEQKQKEDKGTQG